jgi:hypothetical protein
MGIVLDYTKKHNIPLTRENYLAIAYLGDPPDELGAEEEAEIPEENQSSITKVASQIARPCSVSPTQHKTPSNPRNDTQLSKIGIRTPSPFCSRYLWNTAKCIGQRDSNKAYQSPRHSPVGVMSEIASVPCAEDTRPFHSARANVRSRSRVRYFRATALPFQVLPGWTQPVALSPDAPKEHRAPGGFGPGQVHRSDESSWRLLRTPSGRRPSPSTTRLCSARLEVSNVSAPHSG